MGAQIIKRLAWVDLEMTGLDAEKDKIIQIACLVTDLDLNILDEEGFSRYVKITKRDIQKMDEEVKKIHSENGVIENCLKSQSTLNEIDKEVTEYLEKFIQPKESPLCGSSITWDRMFINKQMPQLNGLLHYRNIDVSVLKQLFNMWNTKPYKRVEVHTHEALSDIKGSITELRYYRDKIKDNV